MDGQLAHALATSLWGDRWLTHEGAVDVATFEEDNTVNGLVAGVDFIDPVGGEMHSLADWLAELRRQGSTRLRLVLGDEAPGYAIYADGPAATVWVPAWGVGNFGDPNGQIWSVRYRAELLPAELPEPEVTVDDAVEMLQAAVARCRAFTRTALLPEWEHTFAQAATLLKANAPQIPGYGDLVAPGTPGIIRRLLAAAVTTQISGPMDSWPALSFDDPRHATEFAACSEQLFVATNEAFVAATAGVRRARMQSPRTGTGPKLPGFARKLLPRRADEPGTDPRADLDEQAS